MCALLRWSRSWPSALLFAALLVVLADRGAVHAQEDDPAHRDADAEEASDPAEVTMGERLFLETRFAHFFKVLLDVD